MKKILTIISVTAVVIILAIGGIAANLFLLGEPMRADAIGVSDIQVNESSVKMSGMFFTSADAYKNYKHRTDGDSMYITIYKTVVSSFHKYGIFDIEISGDFSGIKNIYIEGKGETKVLVWKRPNE